MRTRDEEDYELRHNLRHLRSRATTVKSGMFITGIGTAVPPRQFSQTECWNAGKSNPLFRRLAPRSQAIVKRVLLGNNGIATRHLAIDSIDELFDISPRALHARFAAHAPALASSAGLAALKSSQCESGDIDAVIVSTCTGYLCPGLTSYIIESPASNCHLRRLYSWPARSLISRR